MPCTASTTRSATGTGKRRRPLGLGWRGLPPIWLEPLLALETRADCVRLAPIGRPGRGAHRSGATPLLAPDLPEFRARRCSPLPSPRAVDSPTPESSGPGLQPARTDSVSSKRVRGCGTERIKQSASRRVVQPSGGGSSPSRTCHVRKVGIGVERPSVRVYNHGLDIDRNRG